MREKKKANSLYWQLLRVNLIPIFLLALVITSFSINSLTTAMNHEVKRGLMDLSASILTLYDKLYPGDYTMTLQDEAVYLLKGEHQINGDFSIIDTIKEKTGIDITFFYQDIRVITTLYDNENVRIIGSRANAVVEKDVLETGEPHFYPSVSINGKDYFAYYTPVINADGAIMGMLFVAKPTDAVQDSVKKVIMPIILLGLAVMLLAGFLTYRFSDRLVSSIGKIESFLSKVTKGNLDANLDHAVLKRTDELGEMGRYAVNMQRSLRELIERDMLTGIYNRRYAEMQMERIYDNFKECGIEYSIAIGDIDHFKDVNDTYGHECGDVVLTELSKVLKRAMKGRGFAARWGGEEFLLVYQDCTFHKAVDHLNELLAEIRTIQIPYKEEKVGILMTFGIASGKTGGDVESVLREADSKLYEGKNNGRDQIVQ